MKHPNFLLFQRKIKVKVFCPVFDLVEGCWLLVWLNLESNQSIYFYSHEQNFKTIFRKWRFSIFCMSLYQPHIFVTLLYISKFCLLWFISCRSLLLRSFTGWFRYNWLIFCGPEMGKVKSLNDDQRGQIVALRGQKLIWTANICSNEV